MWFPTDHRPPSSQLTPRKERRLPKLERPGGISGWSSDISKPSKLSKTSRGSKDRVKIKAPGDAESTDNTGTKHSTPRGAAGPPGSTREKPFFVEDDQKSKITVLSLRSNRTSRTVQTAQTSLTPRIPEEPTPTGAKKVIANAKKKVKAGLRESSIKRIVASGLCVATALLFLFGVFLPFWSVYTFTVDGSTTGYYGGLWNYCTRSSITGTDCFTFSEGKLDHWFRAARGMELLAWMASMATLGLVVAYMFFLREIKYGFLQWIIIGLCFFSGGFSLIGMIVYGSGESDSSRLSSSFGLTFCAFLGSCIAGGLFLWDKIVQVNSTDASKMNFRGVSSIPGSRGYPGRMTRSLSRASRSGISHVNGNVRMVGTPSQTPAVDENVATVNN